MHPEDHSPQMKKMLNFFHKFEHVVLMILAVLSATILVVAVVRLAIYAYIIIFSKILHPVDIVYEDLNEIFGKIMTLLIFIEFMNSIIHVIRKGDLKLLVKDVTLITGLAICRKLIMLDYSAKEPLFIVSMALVLIAIGIFYFIIMKARVQKLAGPKENRETT